MFDNFSRISVHCHNVVCLCSQRCGPDLTASASVAPITNIVTGSDSAYPKYLVFSTNSHLQSGSLLAGSDAKHKQNVVRMKIHGD